MNIGIVGSGPGVEAVRTALGTSGAGTIESVGADDVASVDLGIVIGTTGSEVFDRVNTVARRTESSWFAVELGGIGGRSVCDAAVTGFGASTACYSCLRARVTANTEAGTAADDPTIDPATARLAGARAGYEAHRLRADTSGDPLGRVVELPHAERRVLPVPNCDCAGERETGLRREAGTRDLNAARSSAEGGLDRRVGIVREVGEAASFPAPYYLARIGDTGGFSDASAASEAAGVAVDWNRAFMKALGEALERYSAGVYRTDEFVHASADALDTAVPLDSFVLPDGSAVAPDETMPWIDGEHLATGDPVALPAESVVFPPPESHGPAITTGLSLGNAGAEALVGGLYEVIERDAAMLSWYSTFEPLGLAVEDEAFGTLAERARSVGLDVTPVLLTQDVDVPVVGVAVERDTWPRFAVGSAASFDPVAAARSALCEALQSWMELRAMGPEAAETAEGAIGRYATEPGAAGSFFDVDGEIPAASVGPEAIPTGGDELDAVVDRVSDAGLDAYGARLTTRDVAELGFEAVRVVVPGAQPLFTDEAFFGERARTVPDTLGFEPRPDRGFHPYP